VDLAFVVIMADVLGAYKSETQGTDDLIHSFRSASLSVPFPFSCSLMVFHSMLFSFA